VPDEFLTIAEVAEMLKINQQTVRNMIDRGEMGAVRVGQRRCCCAVGAHASFQYEGSFQS
jgi:excisionase family DNA binding protein